MVPGRASSISSLNLSLSPFSLMKFLLKISLRSELSSKSNGLHRLSTICSFSGQFDSCEYGSARSVGHGTECWRREYHFPGSEWGAKKVCRLCNLQPSVYLNSNARPHHLMMLLSISLQRERLRLLYQYYLFVECIPDCFMFYVLSFYMYLSTLQSMGILLTLRVVYLGKVSTESGS